MNSHAGWRACYAAQVLGPCELVKDCSWEHRMSTVLRLRDTDGRTWFMKRHGDRERYDAELLAYRTWVPALSGSARDCVPLAIR